MEYGHSGPSDRQPRNTLKEGHKASIADDAKWLKQLDRYIGDLPLDEIHMGTLAPFIEARKCDGVKSRTINNVLKVVRRILNLAAEEWVDEFALTWLAIAPKIKLFVESDLRNPIHLTGKNKTSSFVSCPGT